MYLSALRISISGTSACVTEPEDCPHSSLAPTHPSLKPLPGQGEGALISPIDYLTNVLATVLTVALLLICAGTALAHERVDSNSFRFAAGWALEPAIEGQKNAVELRVTNRESGQPVTGLEKTLQVEFRYGEARARGKLRVVATDPGYYLADLLPTRAGVYEFRFRGTVEGAEVEVVFKSDDVVTAAEMQFPDRLPSSREVAGVVQNAQETARAAHRAAATSHLLAWLGIGMGMLGMLCGGAAIALRRRGRERPGHVDQP